MKKTKDGINARIFLFFIVLVILSADQASAMMNPAAVYCNGLGYEYADEKCKLPDGQTVDPWAFLYGKVAQEYNYCKREGYEIKTVTDEEKCRGIVSEICAVCILEDGSEVEVTKLMGLGFGESDGGYMCGNGVCEPDWRESRRKCPKDCVFVCGDGNCSIKMGEDAGNCPEDCPTGSADGYCDGAKDGICDPDCLPTFDTFLQPK